MILYISLQKEKVNKDISNIKVLYRIQHRIIFNKNFELKSKVFYYVKCLSNNRSNENINTGVSREIIFQKKLILAFQFMFCLETFILDYWEKTWTENQQLFDGIIDVAQYLKEQKNSTLFIKRQGSTKILS